MYKIITWLAVLTLVIIGGWYWYSTKSDSVMSGTLGTYEYACENGSRFAMTPHEDMSEITIEGGSQDMFSGSVRLAKMGDAAHYETTSGQLIVLSGAGEEVRLTVGEESTVCNPVPNAEMAPWNWGDAGEGSGIQPEVSLVVGESIIGKWQSTDDEKFVREFREGDVVIDYYDGKETSKGFWVAFAKSNPPKMVSFPIEENTAYVQITETGAQEDTLNFKVVKLTPDELVLIYMERGGTLTFKAVK